MPQINLTAKEILIVVQAIRLAMESGELYDYAKKGQIDAIRNKLQNVKDL